MSRTFDIRRKKDPADSRGILALLVVLSSVVIRRLSLRLGFGSRLCGFRSAYPAQKLLDSARRFPLSWCRWAMARCGQTDLAMKSGGGDGQELLTALLMELSCRERDGAC